MFVLVAGLFGLVWPVLSGRTSTRPLIIWWTERLFPHLGTVGSDDEVISCGLGECLATKSRRYYEEEFQLQTTPVTFLFYGTDLEVEDLPLESRQIELPVFWALLHEESPLNNYVLSHDPMIELFNLTATFSRFSDYPLTTLFLPNQNYLWERRPVPLAVKNKLRRNGAAPILYVQSHCDVPSDRDRYVAELSRYVSIDSFGQCLHNRDLPEGMETPESFNDARFFDFIANYKFHMAFENAICEDYITEKLFRALHVGSVPIYHGSTSVRDWVPHSQSVILVSDFKSPKELADFITTVDSNDTLYETFLQFKDRPINEQSILVQHLRSRPWSVYDDTTLDFIRGFECFVCDQMIEAQQKLSEMKSTLPKVANRSHMGCPPPVPSTTLASVHSTEVLSAK